jgi:hypothetical protein
MWKCSGPSFSHWFPRSHRILPPLPHWSDQGFIMLDRFAYLKPIPRARLTHRPDDGGSKDLWNIGKLLSDYMAQYPRRVTFIPAAVRTRNRTYLVLEFYGVIYISQNFPFFSVYNYKIKNFPNRNSEIPPVSVRIFNLIPNRSIIKTIIRNSWIHIY